jgi:sedoheptulokinase
VELKRAQIYAMMNQAALADDEAAGLNVIPFFNGSRTKGEELRASISGISRENFHIKNLIRATLEGMVEEIAAPYLALPPEERAHAGIVASGNGIRRNPALRVIAEKKFGLPIRLSPFEEEAALGAALLVNRIR